MSQILQTGRHIAGDQIRIEIHNWDLENSDTFDKSNKKKYFKD